MALEIRPTRCSVSAALAYQVETKRCATPIELMYVIQDLNPETGGIEEARVISALVPVVSSSGMAPDIGRVSTII